MIAWGEASRASEAPGRSGKLVERCKRETGSEEVPISRAFSPCSDWVFLLGLRSLRSLHPRLSSVALSALKTAAFVESCVAISIRGFKAVA